MIRSGRSRFQDRDLNEDLDGERMHPALQFGVERSHNVAMLCDPAQPLERVGLDADAEMAFASRPVTGMALMP